METGTVDSTKSDRKKQKKKFNLRYLRISLKYRPNILKLILNMRQSIRKKSLLLRKIKQDLLLMEKYINNINNSSTKSDTLSNDATLVTENNKPIHQNTLVDSEVPKIMQSDCVTKMSVKDSSTQTDEVVESSIEVSNKSLPKENENKMETTGWDISKNDEGAKSIAEQVKEAAQSALQQSGMVYVESARMYYDYKTGYYYNSELGLYYHTDTGCYYYYSDDKKEFVFHSYPDRTALAANASLDAHEKRKARKHKKAMKTEEEIDNLSNNLAKDQEDDASKPKRKKKSDKKKVTKTNDTKSNGNQEDKPKKDPDENEIDIVPEKKDNQSHDEEKGNVSEKQELEDGECSETESEKSILEQTDDESDASTATASDDDAVAKHHPPCMRVIVRDTKLPKLKVGTLFLVTKDGGTIGREGDHTIIIKDFNISRNHLDIRYDMDRRMYVATDLGSKNGTLLNGIQMSESQVVSKPMEVMHGSTIQLGETKLLCHIHPGNDTCGHCEPGLLMETQEKEKVAYTRTCSVQKQHQLELARLKNKYAPEPLMIEDGSYNDRAKARRETVGSSHHSEKTESTDVNTFIASENKGFKLLEKMGWSKGEGLGKDNQGDTEPIPLVSNEGKAGLGTIGSTAAPASGPLPKIRNKLGPATLRLASKSKLLQPPAKAFQNTLEDDSE